MLNLKEFQLKTEQEIMSKWHDKNKIVVSVVCATYNHEPYIEDAIKSVLMQETDFAFEIIIHDDASTDKTADIIRDYQNKYPNIIKPIYQEENQYSKGDFRPTPYAEQFAGGDYIARCEGDDFWILKTKLDFQYNFLKNNPDYVVCGTNCLIVNQVNEVLYEDRWSHKGYQILMTPTVMYRKLGLSQDFYKYFVKISNADTAFFLYLELYGKAHLENIISTAYRVSSSGIWSQTSTEKRLLMSTQTWRLLLTWAEEIDNIYIMKVAFGQLTDTYASLFVLSFKQMKTTTCLESLVKLFKLTFGRRRSKYPNLLRIVYAIMKKIIHHKKITEVNY